MIKPIPKRLLPHSCTYQKYLGNTGEGDEWDDEITLNYVKIEQKMQLKVTSNGREVIGNAKMFYDLTNSKGLTSEPVENSIINFNGKDYRIVSTDSLSPDYANVHHYEVLLK